ncbi:Zn-dependent protease with chaperone function [metagenome]|uniref:Zn-dependent protease with chaperone function n=1 Tax=metagenome TaxID=256318 RepID=A0A2P2BW40_9ZZZZ
MKNSSRPVALVVLALGSIAFVALAVWLVPWHPVPGGTPSPVPADQVFSASHLERAESFARQARMLSCSSLALSLVVGSILGFSSWGRRLMDRLAGPWWLQVTLGAGLVLLAGRLATLPLSLALRSRLLDYGLSNQSLAGYFRDVGTSFLLGWLVSAIVLLVLVGSARRWSRAWPAVAGVSLAGLVMVGSFVYPVLIEPLFNHFEPLPAGALRTQILDLAQQEGVRVDDVLVSDASRRTTTLNAYVSGYGDTRRIVVYDNLVDDLPVDETLSVVAHELAHARFNDPLLGSALAAAGVFAAVGLLGLILGSGRRRGLPGLDQAAVVPLVIVLTSWGSLLASPVQNTISRSIETRADVAALQTTRDPDAFIAVQRQLAVRGLNDPTPPAISQLWFGSHPTSLTRIAIAEQLAPGLTGDRVAK